MTFYIVIVLIGTGILLNNLGYEVFKYWPIILIAIGIKGIIDKLKKKI